MGDVDDPFCVADHRGRWCGDLENGLAVLDEFEVAAGTERASAVSLHPLKEIASVSRRLDPQLSELRRGEGEEGVP